jgi:hypothetical protein
MIAWASLAVFGSAAYFALGLLATVLLQTRAEMRNGFAGLRGEMASMRTELRDEMHAGFSEIRHEMHELLDRLTAAGA